MSLRAETDARVRRVRVRPLPSAVFLGARHILAMSAGYQRTPDEARPVLQGYSHAAQVMGPLLDRIFLDVIDEEVVRVERRNEMIGKLDPPQRDGFKGDRPLRSPPVHGSGPYRRHHEKPPP